MSSLTRQKPLKIGPYVQGEIPLPHVFYFLNADGSAIPLSGFAAAVTIAPLNNPAGSWEGSAVVTDAAAGEVTYSFAANDMANDGNFILVFWAGDGGTYLLASPEHQFYVRPLSSSAAPVL